MNQRNSQARRRPSPLARCLPWAVAALTFGATAAHAGGNIYEGEGAISHGAAPAAAQGFESVATASASVPMANATAVEPVQPSVASSVASGSAQTTRAEVLAEARRWRQEKLATPSNEIGDTPEVLQAREGFYALQTEQIEAEYRAAAEQAQQQADAAAQQALVEEAMALFEPGSDSFIDESVALQAPSDERVMPADERQIIVRPEMTVGELMSYLEEAPESADVTVLMVSSETDFDD